MSDLLYTLSILPFSFWVALSITVFFGYRGWQLRETAVGIPMIVVLLTVMTWYFGDAIYNNYSEYCDELTAETLERGWWEVLIFVAAFVIFAPMIHQTMNRDLLRRPSSLLRFIRYGGVNSPKFQCQIDLICLVLLIPWYILMSIALFRTDFNFQGLFAPYLAEKADPWGRGRIGGGYDSLLSAANYTQIGLAAAFGVVAAVAFRSRTLITALLICFLTFPFYIFDRTRNSMLAVILPGFFTFVFLRVRAPMIVRVAILVVGFWIAQNWLMFVIQKPGTDLAASRKLSVRE